MSEIELIVFDMGGVLSFYNESIPISEFARMSGKPETFVFDSLFSVKRKRPLETGLQAWTEFVLQANDSLGLDLEEAEFRRIFDSSHFTSNRELFGLVDALSSQHRIGVCSNTGPTHWELQRRRLPFFERFDPVILSCEVGTMKPDTRIFEELARRSDTPYDRIVFIDDY